jgi:hypothetical protein
LDPKLVILGKLPKVCGQARDKAANFVILGEVFPALEVISTYDHAFALCLRPPIKEIHLLQQLLLVKFQLPHIQIMATSESFRDSSKGEARLTYSYGIT